MPTIDWIGFPSNLPQDVGQYYFSHLRDISSLRVQARTQPVEAAAKMGHLSALYCSCSEFASKLIVEA